MPKINIAYVKAHPVMFGAIVIVFGLLFWLLINKGSGGGGGVSVVNSGPSDAQVAAGVQQNLAQLQANTQLQLAQLSLAGAAAQIEGQKDLAAMELNYQIQELGAQHDIGVKTIEASLASLSLQLNTQSAISHDNNQFQLDYAKNAQDSAVEQLLIGANLQRDLSAQQLEAFKFSTAASIIPTLKKGRRDNAFFALTGTTDYLVSGGAPAGSGSTANYFHG